MEPQIVKKLKSLNVNEGSGFELTCEIQDQPDLDVTWTKNGLAVSAERFKITKVGSVHKLICQHSSMEDAGRYVCCVRNEFGEKRTMAGLVILKQTPPSYTQRDSGKGKRKCVGGEDLKVEADSKQDDVINGGTPENRDNGYRKDITSNNINHVNNVDDVINDNICSKSENSNNDIQNIQDKNFYTTYKHTITSPLSVFSPPPSTHSSSSSSSSPLPSRRSASSSTSSSLPPKTLNKTESAFASLSSPSPTASQNKVTNFTLYLNRTHPSQQQLHPLRTSFSTSDNINVEHFKIAENIKNDISNEDDINNGAYSNDVSGINDDVNFANNSNNECNVNGNNDTGKYAEGNISDNSNCKLSSFPDKCDHHNNHIDTDINTSHSINDINDKHISGDDSSNNINRQNCNDDYKLPNHVSTTENDANISPLNDKDLIKNEKKIIMEVSDSISLDETSKNIVSCWKKAGEHCKPQFDVVEKVEEVIRADKLDDENCGHIEKNEISPETSENITLTDLPEPCRNADYLQQQQRQQNPSQQPQQLDSSTLNSDENHVKNIVINDSHRNIILNQLTNLEQQCDGKLWNVDLEDQASLIKSLHPENLHVLKQSEIMLTATFQRCYKCQEFFISWFKGPNEVKTAGRLSIETTERTSVLRVREAVTNDSECYSVVVRCRCVTSQMSSSVTVEDCPDPPFGRPATTNETTDSIVLSWYGPVFDGASPVIGYKVEQKLSGKHHDWIVISDLCQHTTFHVKNLRAHTSYNFRISCVNKHGCSRPGIACEARTKGNGGENSVEQNGVTQFDDGGKFAFEPRIVSIRRDKKFPELYISGELIGRGKFGVVQECFEIKTNRKLAAKVIKLKQGQKEEFREEVNIMNKLHHVKLLQLYDAFETAREAVLIMEFIEGRELMERIINEDYSLTERDCIYFLRQICSGIKYMHDLNVLHLDIKPENILCVRPDCNDIKIIDFGLSRMYDEKKPVKVMFGTAEFAAPEVINYDPVTPLTDMWSVGVVCYILLSGFSPFAGNSDAETFVNVTKVQYDFDEGFEDVSTKAQEFISCLLARNPKERMTSSECLSHDWLVQYEDVTLEKTLDTTQHRKFLTRRKWQKSGNALRALSRLTGESKGFKSKRGFSVDRKTFLLKLLKKNHETHNGTESTQTPNTDSLNPSANRKSRSLISISSKSLHRVDKISLMKTFSHHLKKS